MKTSEKKSMTEIRVLAKMKKKLEKEFRANIHKEECKKEHICARWKSGECRGWLNSEDYADSKDGVLTETLPPAMAAETQRARMAELLEPETRKILKRLKLRIE